MRLALSLTALLLVAPNATGADTTTSDSQWQPAKWRTDTQAARLWLKRQMPKRQWRCLDTLWSAESGWQVRAGSYHKAYGIPQAYPGYRMRSAGRDWRTNAMTQVRWGIHYVRGRYGRPCAALRFQDRHGWY